MAKKKMTTPNIEKIAEMAGVTKGTVSKILNKKANFSPEVTERVENLLEKHGYMPKIQRRPVYVITRYASSSLPMNSNQLLLGALEEARTHGIVLDIKYTHVPYHSEPRSSIFAYVKEQKPTGVLIDVNYPWPKKVLEFFLDCDFPVVQFGFENHIEELPSVVVDSMNAVYTGVKNLIKKGHRKIATIRWQFSKTNLPEILPKNSATKHAGYLAAMGEAGIKVPDEYVATIYHLEEKDNPRRAREIVESFLSLPEPPTAVFVENSYCSLPLLIPASEDGGCFPDKIRGLEYLHFEDYPRQEMLLELKKLGYKFPPGHFISPDFESIGKAGLETLVSLFNGASAGGNATCHKIIPAFVPIA